MAEDKKVNFYGNKPPTLPRFVYRRLAQALQAKTQPRADLIQAALSELLTGKDPDLRKFKFSIPGYLRQQLTAAEIAHFSQQTLSRQKRAAQLKMVFPHVSDEFSLEPEFLSTLFDLEGGPRIQRGARFFTVGSCFARNIAQYLAVNGQHASTFGLAEDLNSPMSNAFLLSLVGQTAERQLAIISHWIDAIFSEFGEAEKAATAAAKQREIGELSRQLKEADCVILTLGNVVDFFRDDGAQARPLMENIFPKFIAMPGSEDINVRSAAAARLKGKGALLRLATYGETFEAIRACIDGIRSVTKAALVVTISPVPIDSVIGLTDAHLKSAIEVDCVSKSRIRSAFDEVLAREQSAQAIHYFPSFEIVRWIAPLLSIPAFGLDDAASRHVSSPILDAVCSLFVQRFIKFADDQAAA
jgi:GSCFA family protein